MSEQSSRPASLVGPRLAVPRIRPEVVSRPRLLDELDRGLRAGRPMTLVAAPAGYGKTTLVVEWLRRAAGRVAWITLEDALNDPGVFLTYLGAAIARSGLILSADSAAAVGGYGRPSVDALAPLVNDLEEPGEQLFVVLDDYQSISSREVHGLVDFLVAHAPSRLHLVILSREDPPLPLARLRARDQLTEIREAQLRFTLDEAGSFYSTCAGVDISSDTVSALAERTEGWAAGLQLAGLSLRGVADPTAFVERFSGSDRYVLDYLVDEVLARQPADTVEFLRKTCILTRLTGSLCNALTGRSDGSRVLVSLEASNLFVTSLDESRDWYRYHSLFGEALRALLDPNELPELQARASAWFDAHAMLSDAIHHALAGDDAEHAALLIERGLDQTIKEGSFLSLSRWLAQLPPAVIRQHPALVVGDAWGRLMLGDIGGAEDRLRDVDSREGPVAGAASPSFDTAAHRIPVLEAWIANRRDAEDAENVAVRAIDGVPESDPLFRALAFMAFGEIAFRRNAPASAPAHAMADAISARLGRPSALFGTVWNLGLAYLLSGERRKAVEVSLSALQGQQDRTGRWQGLGASALVPLGMAEYEADELEAAIEHLELGLELCQRAGIRPIVHGTVDWYLIEALQANGRRDRAWQLAESARDEAARLGMPFAVALLNVAMAELRLREGDLAAAERQMREMPANLEAARFVRTRLALALGAAERALDEADALVAFERSAGRLPRIAGAQALAALAIERLGRRDEALARLDEALSLAAPQQYRRALLDQGPALGHLLTFLRPTCQEAAAFRADLLHRFEAAASPRIDVASTTPATARSNSGLVEPLGDRELEVLPLLAAGLSNAEIARALYIGPGTAKWHVHNILGKLGIERRAQVASRARELGLLPG